MAQSDSIVSINSYVDALRRRLKIVVVCAVIGAVLGAVLLSSQERQFVANSTVQVRPIVAQSSDPNLDVTRQIDIESEVRVASSQRVAEWALAIAAEGEKSGSSTFSEEEVKTAGALAVSEGTVDRQSAQDQLDLLTVSVKGTSNILQFTASAGSPEKAQAVAQSTAIAYLEFRRTQATQVRDTARQRLIERETQLTVELDELTDTRSKKQIELLQQNPGGTAVVPQSAAEIAKTQELSDIGSNYAALEVSTVDPGVVLTDASIPVSRVGLPPTSGLALGGMLGLIVGMSVAYVLDRQDDRIRSADAEITALGAQVLGSAPVDRRKFGSPAPAETLVAASGKASDSYRRLHGSATFALEDGDKSLVLVAGVTNAHAGSLVLANMAVTAARAGRRTLLVGADLRHHLMEHYLAVSPAFGLSDVILRARSLAEAVEVVPNVENLNFLSAGAHNDRPDVIVQSEAFGRLMTVLEADYDLVLVEAPPVLSAADAVDIARVCDGTLLVVDSETESRQAISDAIAQLRNVGSSIDGVIVAKR